MSILPEDDQTVRDVTPEVREYSLEATQASFEEARVIIQQEQKRNSLLK